MKSRVRNGLLQQKGIMLCPLEKVISVASTSLKVKIHDQFILSVFTDDEKTDRVYRKN